MVLPDRLFRCKSAISAHKQDDCSNFRPISLTLQMYLEKIPAKVHFQRGVEVLVSITAKISPPAKPNPGGTTDTSIPDLQALSACRAAGPCNSLSWCLDVVPAQGGFAHICPHLLGSPVWLVFLRLNPSYLSRPGDASPISMKLLGGHLAARFSKQ